MRLGGRNESQLGGTEIENGRANDREQRRRQVITCKRVCVSADLCRVAACGSCAALVTAGRLMMPAMRWACAIALMGGA
jgi:hypothetical protein